MSFFVFKCVVSSVELIVIIEQMKLEFILSERIITENENKCKFLIKVLLKISLYDCLF